MSWQKIVVLFSLLVRRRARILRLFPVSGKKWGTWSEYSADTENLPEVDGFNNFGLVLA